MDEPNNSEDLFSNQGQSCMRITADENEAGLCITEYSQNFQHDSMLSLTQEQKLENLRTAISRYHKLPHKSISDLENLEQAGPNDNCYVKLVACVLSIVPIHEIWVKSALAWKAKATVVLGHPSQQKPLKICLWGDFCKHALSLKVGDVVCIAGFKVKTFNNATVILLNRFSSFINFGSSMLIQKQDQAITLPKQCAEWYLEKHGLECKVINKLSVLDEQVEMVKDFESLIPGHVVHIQGKPMAFKKATTQTETSFVCMRDKSGNLCRLYLHGSATQWEKRVIKFSKYLWEFYNVACCSSSYDEKVGLHTSVFSSAQCLFEEEENLNEIEPQYPWVSSYKELEKFTTNNVTVCLNNVQILQCTLFISELTTITKLSTESDYKQWLQSLLESCNTDSLNATKPLTLACQFVNDCTVFEVHMKQQTLFEILGFFHEKSCRLPSYISNTATAQNNYSGMLNTCEESCTCNWHVTKCAYIKLKALFSKPQKLEVLVTADQFEDEIIQNLQVFVNKLICNDLYKETCVS
ncbi:shieldin complex subunit 2-like [Ciona intestinalis]